jgi:cell division protein FtsQ
MTKAPPTDPPVTDPPVTEVPPDDVVWADTETDTEAGPEMDPRMEQRRADVHRDHARGRRRAVLALISLIGLGSAAWAVTRTPLLEIHDARVSGIDQTTASDIVHAGHLDQGRPMTDIDEAGAARRIRALPWIGTARVRRQWPRTVIVDVTERVPTAIATANGGGWALLDGTGRVLTLLQAPEGDYPMLDGVPAAGPPGSRLGSSGRPALAVSAALGPDLRPKVALVLVQGEEVEMRLRPEGVVRLGRPDQLVEKLAALRTMVARADLRRLAVLDLRVPTNPVLTRQA